MVEGAWCGVSCTPSRAQARRACFARMRLMASLALALRCCGVRLFLLAEHMHICERCGGCGVVVILRVEAWA